MKNNGIAGKKLNVIFLTVLVTIAYIVVALCNIANRYMLAGLHQNRVTAMQRTTQIENESSTTAAEETAAAHEEIIVEETAVVEETVEERIQRTAAALPTTAQIQTEAINQYPELPTGCESVALTMALNVYGYGLGKTTIADEYLIYDAGNFATRYMGNPYTYEGAGIFPPGLTETANQFLSQQDTELQARDISGKELTELYSYLANGIPVVVWTTMYFEYPTMLGNYAEYNGKTYQWYLNEHCVMLGGYNQEAGTVTVYDPMQGVVDVNAAVFADIYAQTGMNAITIY